MAEISPDGMAACLSLPDVRDFYEKTALTADVNLYKPDEYGRSLGFVAYARICVSRMCAEGRYDAACKLDAYVERFVAYLGCGEILFSDFNSQLVCNYYAWLNDRKICFNSVSLYVRNLKRVYRSAVNAGQTDERIPSTALT